MLYNNFVVVTDTPGRLKDFLIARGVIEEYTAPDSGQIELRGVRPGMEWVKVPNPIITDNSDPLNPVYDTRAVYLVKFAHESLEDDVIQGSPTPETGDALEWSKFGSWVRNNSTVQTAPAQWTINGEPVGNAHKINGENVWLIRDRPERF